MALFGQGDKKNEKKGPALAEKVRALTEAGILRSMKIGRDLVFFAVKLGQHGHATGTDTFHGAAPDEKQCIGGNDLVYRNRQKYRT